MCLICYKFKTKLLNLEQVKSRPNEIRQAEHGSTFNNSVIWKGTAIPLLALIFWVVSGLSALTSNAGITASVMLGS